MSKRKVNFSKGSESGPVGNPFIIEVDTTDTSNAQSGTDSIILPFDEGNTVNLLIDWGDGGALEAYTDTDNECSHTYTTGGTYDIYIYNQDGPGSIPWTLNLVATDRRDYSKFYDLKQFGDCYVYQTGGLRTWWNCANLSISATDYYQGAIVGSSEMTEYMRNCDITTISGSAGWDLTMLTEMDGWFFANANLNLDISNWDVSTVDTFASLFASCTNYNPDVSTWNPDMTVLTNMTSMFSNCKSFNTNVSILNPLGNTVAIASMFSGCDAFTGTGLDTWNTSGVTSMNSTFNGCDSMDFSKIEGWNVGNVTTFFRALFGVAGTNTSIASVDLSGWDVSSVSDFYDMFGASGSANPDVTGWTLSTTYGIRCFFMFRSTPFDGTGLSTWTNTSSIDDAEQMFLGCNLMDADLSGWDMSGCKKFISFMNGCSSFTGPIFTDISSVESIARILNNCSSFDGTGVEQWVLPTTNVTDLTSMFQGCDIFNADIGGLLPAGNVVNDIDNMLYQCYAFDQDISGWDVSGVTTATNFGLSWGMSTDNYDKLLIGWSAQSLQSGVTTTMSSSYTAGTTITSTTTATNSGKLEDSSQAFTTSVNVGDIVVNTDDGTYAEVLAINSDTVLTIENDIMTTGQNYRIDTDDAAKARYVMTNDYSWTITDSGPATAPNMFLGGVGATSITSAADYAALFSIDESDIYSFRVDANNNVSFYAATNHSSSASGTFQNDTDLTYFIDKDSRITGFGQWNDLDGTTNMEFLYLPGLVSVIGSSRAFWNFNNSNLKRTNMENISNYEARNSYGSSSGIAKLDLRSATQIGWWQDDDAYRQLWGMSGLQYVYLGEVTSLYEDNNGDIEIYDYTPKELLLEDMGAAKVYHSATFGATDRYAYARLQSTTSTPFDVGDTIDIDGLTYTAISGTPTADGEFDVSTSGANNQFGNLVTAVNTDGRTHTTDTLTSSFEANFSAGYFTVRTTTVTGASANAAAVSLGGGNTGDAVLIAGGPNFVGGTDVHIAMANLRDLYGATLVEVNNIIAVNIPTGLSASNITINSFDLNFTEPTANANGTETYEVWVSEVGNQANPANYFYYQDISGTGGTITGLTPSTLYDVKVRTQDGQMQFSEFSNTIQVKTSHLYTGAIAHSLRDVHQSWTNAVVQLRRSSDNDTATVFFDDSGVISLTSLISDSSNTSTPDATTLATWLGSDDAFVRSWYGMTDDNVYDSAYLVSQGANAEQPQIATAGVLNTYNGKVCLTPDGTKYIQNLAPFTEMNANNDWTWISVTAANTGVDGDVGFIASTGTGASFNRADYLMDLRTSAVIGNYSRNSGSDLFQTTYLSQNTSQAQRLLAWTLDFDTEVKAYYNGVLQDTTALTGTTFINSAYRLMRGRNNGSFYFEGAYQEIILIPSDVSSDISEFNDEINTYYNIYGDNAPNPYLNNLVAAYNFDSDSTDYTTNHDGTDSNMSYANAGKVGNCATFDGSSSGIEIVDSDELSFTDGAGNDYAFSISFWVYFDDFTDTNEIVEKFLAGGSGNEWLVNRNGTTLNFLLYSGGATTVRIGKTYDMSSLSTATWYHFVLTYDGSESDTGINIYRDGSLVTMGTSSSGSYTGMSNTTEEVRIGTRNGTANFLAGRIDSLYIWKQRELSSSEANEIYTTENGGTAILP